MQSVGDKEVADKGFKPLLKVKYPKRHGRRFHIVKEDKSEHNNKFKYGSVILGAEYETGK